MEDELSPHVRDYQIETRFPKKRVVEHVYDDGNTLPECWKSEKRPLGSGGQGTVYLQTCTSGSRRYTQRAVKVIPLQERNVKRYYLRELQIVVRFSHDRYSRYFVKSLGWYLSGNTLCIAMEYLAKGDLEMYLRSKPPLLEIECRQIIAQVTKALALMHKEGYTHRDIKPQNVLIQEHPVDDGLSIWWVKLTDFGISKPLETATSGASTTTGTLLYMAPERLGWGNNTNISYPAADIWALGVMSYRLLAGTDLFPTVGKIFQYCGHPELGVLDNHKISTDGAAFIHALLRPQASLRLESAAALVHDWIRPYTTSSAQAAVVPDLHSESSSEPSRNSSFDEERGWTTILSNATDLRNHLPIDPRAQPALSPIRRASTTSKNVDKAGVTAMAVVEMRGSADASVDEGQSHAATSKGHLATLQTLPINNKTISNTTATWQLQQTLPGHNNMVWSVAFSPDSKLLASGSYGGTIRIWNTATWQLQQTLPGHNDVVHSVAFSPDSKFLASGSHDGTIRLWNTATWQLQQTLPDHDDIVHSVAFSPDSKLLASSSWDMTIRLWNTATWQLQQTLQGHNDSVHSVAFSPDSKLLASSSSDKTIRLWNTATWQLQQTLPGHNDSVQSVAFSPDSKLLASSSSDGTIRLWNTATWQLQQTLQGHNGPLYSVAFSPDSKLLASGSYDKTIRIWNTATWQLQQTLPGHNYVVWLVVFSPDSKLLASGSSNGNIRLWDIATNTPKSQ